MRKIPEFKLITAAARRRLRRELRQMWSSVPPHALARAHQLAGVQPGKEHQFRVAIVQESEDTDFMDHRLGVHLRAGLVDDVVNGEEAKQLTVQLRCDERGWQIQDWIYAKRFRSIEQLNKWLASIEKHLLLHLSEKLLDTCFFVWDEAVAKACVDHGVRRIDLTALAEAHIKDLRKDKSKALLIKRGARKGSKQSKVYLSKRQVEIDLPKFIRENGEDTTRKEAAQRFGVPNEKAFDRALARHGKRWRKLKVEAIMKIKKGH